MRGGPTRIVVVVGVVVVVERGAVVVDRGVVVDVEVGVVVDVEVEVEVEVEVDVEVDVDVDVVVDVDVGEVVLDVVEDDVDAGVVVLVVGLWHDSVSFRTYPVTGSWIDDSGVPGGTLTVKWRTVPPSSVTVITHVSAEAAGTGVTTPAASTVTAVASATFSLPLLNTVALLLPPSRCADCGRRRTPAPA